jgi:YbbR domain-containing protein
MAIIKLSATERRRISVFLTCLVLAVCAWLVLAFSSTYSYTTKKLIRYKNVPLKRSFHSLQSDTIEAVVTGTGWQMLFARVNEKSAPITVDLRSLEQRPYITLSSQLQSINAEMPRNNPIKSFNPDTLYFDFSNRSIRRIPVKLLSAINYQKQFSQSDDVIIEPSYVTVSGPSGEIDRMNTWPTDSLKAKDVNETIKTAINLKPPAEGNITIYPKTVQVKVPVNEFTEKTIRIPVKIINNTGYYNIKVIPQRVEVTFTTSLNRYADIDADLFEAQVDLEYWKKYGYSTLPVKIIRVPEFCKIVSVEPRNIDFIIKQ